MIASHFSLDACVVDQDIAGPGLRDQVSALVCFRHVGLDVACGNVEFLGNVAGQGVILLAVDEGVQHHIRARPRQFARDAEADA